MAKLEEIEDVKDAEIIIKHDCDDFNYYIHMLYFVRISFQGSLQV